MPDTTCQGGKDAKEGAKGGLKFKRRSFLRKCSIGFREKGSDR